MKFQIIKTRDGSLEYWTVCRIDGKSFRDGVVGYNFECSEQGAQYAIECRNKLEAEES
jgi:hypothetical protein